MKTSQEEAQECFKTWLGDRPLQGHHDHRMASARIRATPSMIRNTLTAAAKSNKNWQGLVAQ
jgi:hypothetical protein